MIGPGSLKAGADALSDTIGGMFDIPESHFVEQAEESFTLGSESYETGKTDTQPEDPWDPFAGW
jgi:hypothetical protein